VIESIGYLSYHTSPLLIPGSGDAGGMNVYIDELAREMAGRGVCVDVYTRKDDPSLPDEIRVTDRYRVVHIEAGPAEKVGIGELVDWVEPFTDAAVEFAQEEGCTYDLLHSHYWLSGRIGLEMKDALGVPLANSFHTLGRVKDLTRRADDARSSPTRILTEQAVIERSDCVIASTPAEARDLLEHYGADPTRLCMNPPGISHELFYPGNNEAARARLGFAEGPLVLFVGRIQPLKGVDVALEAVALARRDLPDLRMVIVGGPSGIEGHIEAERLRRRAAEPDLEGAVLFLPAQPHHTLADFYRAADVVICPSRSESFGLVAVEAQACATPVIAANVGGLAFGVANEESGLLIDGWDPPDYADALVRFFTERGLARLLSEGARERSRIFTWKAAADRLLELYDGLTE
jgi:D-inositol-3-phosphate glycosyltransferase